MVHVPLATLSRLDSAGAVQLRHRMNLIDTWNQPCGASAEGVVLGAELRAQQSLFRPDAGEQRWNQECREQHADPRPKSEAPSQCVHEQPQITRVADDTIDAVRDQRVPGLDGHESTEARAKHEHWPESQRPASGE